MRLRVFDRIGDIPASAWDGLHDGANPFVFHAFLHGMETTGCLRQTLGWVPKHAALYSGERLLAAVPAYEKTNSHGEFVFDHAWAAAYAQAGFAYYPKWLVGIPYSPVPGPRVLGQDAQARHMMLTALREESLRQGHSSLHINFLSGSELDVFDNSWLERHDVQFHWKNQGWRDFDDFLASLSSKRRKNIRQERRKVHDAGYLFRVVHGNEASEDDLHAMHDFYRLTFAEKGNTPSLTSEFFAHLARAMPRHVMMVLAERDGRTVAGALFLRGGDTLYGRYWGSEDPAPGLHFETCYYQGIDYCLREGLTRFEPGAQGEHKLARGFLPVLTHSRHFVANRDFAEALQTWCGQERDQARRYRDLLLEHSPFRHAAATP